MRLQRRLGHLTTLVAGASLSRFDSTTIYARLCSWPFRSPAGWTRTAADRDRPRRQVWPPSTGRSAAGAGRPRCSRQVAQEQASRSSRGVYVDRSPVTPHDLDRPRKDVGPQQNSWVEGPVFANELCPKP